MASPHSSPRIILATLNAKYIHASLGLRYLLANMGDLKAHTVLREFTIARKPQDVVDELLATLGDREDGSVNIIGLGVYIWNVTQTCEVVRLLKHQRADIKIILGGPEVSHEVDGQDIVRLADHVITGWGDVSFPKLCRALWLGPQPLMKVIAGEQPPLNQIVLPYAEYTEDDLAHRLLYVEASRGCPFKCEFCLSSLDKTAWAFDLEQFLAELDQLYQRGARNFKFVDRTFNLKIEASVRILQFFLERLCTGLFVHFEVIPDHLPDRLKAIIARFPAGVLQFEVGIQTFNADVQQRISRKQDNDATCANLAWMVNDSRAHLHADLIFGLPGETMASFAAGFDRLYGLKPHEIQLGVLKRLRGTPIARHSVEFGMVFDSQPPYTVMQTNAVTALEMQAFSRLARYWELVANSGRFTQTLKLLLSGPSAFQAFYDFSDWLWQSTGQTSRLTPEMLVDALFDYLSVNSKLPASQARQALLADYLTSGARGNPKALKGLLSGMRSSAGRSAVLTARQHRHAEAHHIR